MNLVTGATGLAGSHLLLELCRRGEPVRALKRPSSDMHRVTCLLRDAGIPADRIAWVEGDVLDPVSLQDAMAGVQRVYHCASFVSFVPAEERHMIRVNIDGTAYVVDACQAAGVDKLCHVSSVSAIDRIHEDDIIREDQPWKPSGEHSRYAISKYGAEREVWRGIAEGLKAVIVNPSIILGPGNWKSSSDAIFSRIWKGLRYYTGGVTGWVDVRDVATCMADLMDSDISGERFILNAENVPFRTVFDWVADDLQRPRPTVFAGRHLLNWVWRAEAVRSFLTRSRPLATRETARAGHKKVRFSNDKIRAATGIDFIPVREAVKRTCAVFLAEHGNGER